MAVFKNDKTGISRNKDFFLNVCSDVKKNVRDQVESKFFSPVFNRAGKLLVTPASWPVRLVQQRSL